MLPFYNIILIIKFYPKLFDENFQTNKIIDVDISHSEILVMV